MPTAQVLALHRVVGNAFELTGLRTGSIRDQILRATLLVEALISERKIAKATSPLFVAGGGAAGVAAALTACSHGVDVVLVERHPNPFQVQLPVTTRYLDPTEYDWPHAHWTTADMAWGGQYPLPYTANYADKLARTWTTVLQSLVGPYAPTPPPGFGALDIHYGVDAAGLTFAVSAAGDVTVGHLAGGPLVFAAAISCIGFRGEKTSVPARTGGTYVGPFFWAPDTLDLPHLGAPQAPGPRVKVLVSGGGDGAQQDFLRCATGDFGARLYNRLGLSSLSFPQELLNAQLAEEAARREHSWTQFGKRPGRAFDAWHETYAQLVDSIWHQWVAAGSLPLLAQNVLRSDVDATWIVGAAVPDYCYGLNRLLAMLIVRLIAWSRRRPEIAGGPHTPALGRNEVMLLSHKLIEVAAVGHPVCGSTCWGMKHEAFVEGVTGPISLGQFDFIVVRHGVNQHPLFGSAPVNQQLVPMRKPA